jgi:hypothetical protein
MEDLPRHVEAPVDYERPSITRAEAQRIGMHLHLVASSAEPQAVRDGFARRPLVSTKAAWAVVLGAIALLLLWPFATLLSVL